MRNIAVESKKMPFTISLSRTDIERINTTAKRNELPPRVMARMLLMKGLRAEIKKLDREETEGYDFEY